MKKQYTNTHLRKRYTWWILISILILGAGLRLYRLGDNLFWFDEVGVAIAAQEPSLHKAIVISQSYIMSMPLDYAVAWGMAHISQSEWMLRLPSGIWGSLTLLVTYFLYRELAREHTALLGIFLFALMPIHIKYSQELKFYAPLVFFYVLASYFGLIAVKRKKTILWITFLAITMIGILFHIYTTLVLINLTLWMIVTSNKNDPDHRLWKFFTISMCIILVFAVTAIFLFGKSPSYQSELFSAEPPSQVFLRGLGWIPPLISSRLGLIFGGLCLIFAMIGLAITLSKGSNRFRFAIPISILLQLLLIITGDIINKYFICSRQFLILIPFTVFLTAVGVEKTVSYFTKYAQKQPITYYAGMCLAISIFSIAAVPVLSQYYQTKKVDTLAVVNWLSVNWQNGQTVYIDPGYEIFTYFFYLQRWGSTKNIGNQYIKISESLFPFELSSYQNNPLNVDYLITNTVTDQQASFLKSEGFSLTYISPINVNQPQMIWHKAEKP